MVEMVNHYVRGTCRPALASAVPAVPARIRRQKEVSVLRAEQVGHKAGDRIAVVVRRYGGESIIDLDHVALIEVDKL